jgi:predicted peptidase
VSTQEQDIDKLSKEVDKLKESYSASSSKGSLVEKITFAGIPIMFSCIVYLMSALSNTSHDLTILQGKINVVVNSENKAIPPQGTTIEMERIREESALARASMTLERTKDMAALREEAALGRAKVREDSALARADLDSRIDLLEYKVFGKVR